ncbi:MAG: OmpA family protein [Gammaproteobacteria bacterium]|nr:OmpA family protein [Gammaproteobacteria bacterium]
MSSVLCVFMHGKVAERCRVGHGVDTPFDKTPSGTAMTYARAAFLGFLCLLSITVSAAEDRLLSPFHGSTEIGSFSSRFWELPVLAAPLNERRIPSTDTVEGHLTSHVYQRPEGVAAFEVYRSYLDALRTGGFDILLDCQAPDCNLKLSVNPVYQRSGEFGKRDYGRTGVLSMPTYLLGWTEHYISAKKELPEQTTYVLVFVSRERNLYAVDVLQTAERELGTVTLSVELLSSRIEDTGRSVLEGVLFETGEDVITPESDRALAVITDYLQANPNENYYVVGHTDDTGSLSTNIGLSKARAQAVVKALLDRGIASARLSAEGVGPYSPVATNRNDAGQALNRRVELVRRL